MKDIKQLYIAAKSSGLKSDIDAYTEAVNEAFENKPNDYILNLEYIISSSIGISTLKSFIEKYGLPIACYDYIFETLSNCIEKCKIKNQNDAIYVESITWLEQYRQKYIKCFAMYEYYCNNDSQSYVDVYYKYNENGIQNNKNISGMIKMFSETAIPDLIITGNQITESNNRKLFMNKCLNYIFNKTTFTNSLLCEWITFVCDDFVSDKDIINQFREYSLTPVINNIKSRNKQLYRESLILQYDNAEFEYTETEIKSIYDLISFQEHCLTWNSELSDMSFAQRIQYIGELYDEISDIEEVSADSILQMAPPSRNTPIIGNESHMSNTVPDYIRRNHTMSKYGEEDIDPISKPDSNSDESDKYKKNSDNIHNDKDDDNKSLEDFIRPSALKDNNDQNDLNHINTLDNKSDNQSISPNSVNNYYYYTYNNSMNKNSNSFNRDNSNHDDHSSHNSNRTINDDHSRHIKNDDHSKYSSDNKSTDNHSLSYSADNNTKTNDNHSTSHFSTLSKESSNPWELNLNIPSLITEEVGDADDMKPKSDHPIKDTLTDIDRKLNKYQQSTKKTVQNIHNTGKAFVKPVRRTQEWINRMISDWKDADENKIKEKMADPHQRSTLYKAIRKSIEVGALFKAGLLLNPFFLAIAGYRKLSRNKKSFRIRNEMIGELKTELKIIDEKIKDADNNKDNKAKYQLMRFKNEINKKLMRVGGGKGWEKMI